MATVLNPFTPTVLRRKTPVPSDLDIAQAATLKPIGLVAAELGLRYAFAALPQTGSLRRSSQFCCLTPPE